MVLICRPVTEGAVVRHPARRRSVPAATRSRACLAAACAALVLAATLTGVLPSAAAQRARASDITASSNLLRNGWDDNEPGLSPAVLRSGSFRELFSTRLSGQVYAQPLVIGQLVIAVTEQDWAYGLNARTGRIIWRRHLGTPFPARRVGCDDLVPDMGVTSTPVYDPQTGAVYLIAEIGGASPSFSLFGLSARTGRILQRVRIRGRGTNAPHVRFQPIRQFQRTGLLLMNGWVYAGFGSHCDHRPYTGFVAAVKPADGAVRLWTDEADIVTDQGGIWQAGGGIMSDGPGRIFLSSGNGVSPPRGRGTLPPGALADSVIRLAVRHGGSVVARDFFSPSNAPELDAADTDFGSGGPVGLPFGSPHNPALLVQAGKDGRVFLLNRGSLGGRSQGKGGSDAAVSETGPFGGQWGHPAAFGDQRRVTAASGGHDYVYYVGKDDFLRVLKFGVGHSGRPRLRQVATSSLFFGNSSGSPVVTSSGTRASSAVVWVVRAAGRSGAHGMLAAFPAVPPASCDDHCLLHPLWSAPIGTASKFAIPATSAGRVYVGTRNGRILCFGAGSGPLTGLAQTDFGPVSVGTSAHRVITVTATRPVTVTAATARTVAGSGTFRVEDISGARTGHHLAARLPVHLARGGVLHVHVLLTPSGPGGITGALELAVAGRGGRGIAAVPLAGEGTRAGLAALPGALSFALVPSANGRRPVPVGLRVSQTTDIVNTGTAVQTVQSVSRPASPFTATGLPASGTRLLPGQSVVVQVSYTPQQAGHDAGSLTVTGSSGTSASVRLTGTAVAASTRLRVSPGRLGFGAVRPGTQVSRVITISNPGNQPDTIVRTAGPGGPFGIRYRIPAGQPLNPEDDLRVIVTFTPRRRGSATGSYLLTWAGPDGKHTVTVRLTGQGR